MVRFNPQGALASDGSEFFPLILDQIFIEVDLAVFKSLSIQFLLVFQLRKYFLFRLPFINWGQEILAHTAISVSIALNCISKPTQNSFLEIVGTYVGRNIFLRVERRLQVGVDGAMLGCGILIYHWVIGKLARTHFIFILAYPRLSIGSDIGFFAK